MTILATITANATLDAAFAWLCRRQWDYPSSADVWDFRHRWDWDGEEIDVWQARDALVLKALTIALQPALPASRHCTQIRGHGGAKAAVRRLLGQLGANHFVMRSDVKSYYAAIDHHLLLDRLATHIMDEAVLNLMGQFLRRTAERDGQFFESERGVSLGCPLSLLMAAL